jgi:hypothetical protein
VVEGVEMHDASLLISLRKFELQTAEPLDRT